MDAGNMRKGEMDKMKLYRMELYKLCHRKIVYAGTIFLTVEDFGRMGLCRWGSV